MTLAECAPGTAGQISRVDVAPEYQLRLRELGVRAGMPMRVTARAAFGGVVINVAGARVAIDARSARHIHVEPAPVPQQSAATPNEAGKDAR